MRPNGQKRSGEPSTWYWLAKNRGLFSVTDTALTNEPPPDHRSTLKASKGGPFSLSRPRSFPRFFPRRSRRHIRHRPTSYQSLDNPGSRGSFVGLRLTEPEVTRLNTTLRASTAHRRDDDAPGKPGEGNVPRSTAPV